MRLYGWRNITNQGEEAMRSLNEHLSNISADFCDVATVSMGEGMPITAEVYLDSVEDFRTLTWNGTAWEEDDD